MKWIQNEIARIKFHLDNYFDIENKSFLIIGSQIPWIESLLLYLNAGHVTTLEYNPYKTDHPKITCITPMEFSKLVLSMIFSFSSERFWTCNIVYSVKKNSVFSRILRGLQYFSEIAFRLLQKWTALFLHLKQFYVKCRGT